MMAVRVLKEDEREWWYQQAIRLSQIGRRLFDLSRTPGVNLRRVFILPDETGALVLAVTFNVTPRKMGYRLFDVAELHTSDRALAAMLERALDACMMLADREDMTLRT